MRNSSFKVGALFVLFAMSSSCARNEFQTFGELKIEQLSLQNRDVFVFKSVDEQNIAATEFKPNHPICFTFELSNNTTDTIAWLNYDQLANNENDFIKVYTQGVAVGAPYNSIERTSNKKWAFAPGTMVRFSMTWINNDVAHNEFVSISSSRRMNNFLVKGDYLAKVHFPLVYTKAGVTDTIECNRTIYFSIKE